MVHLLFQTKPKVRNLMRVFRSFNKVGFPLQSNSGTPPNIDTLKALFSRLLQHCLVILCVSELQRGHTRAFSFSEPWPPPLLPLLSVSYPKRRLTSRWCWPPMFTWEPKTVTFKWSAMSSSAAVMVSIKISKIFFPFWNVPNWNLCSYSCVWRYSCAWQERILGNVCNGKGMIRKFMIDVNGVSVLKRWWLTLYSNMFLITSLIEHCLVQLKI